MDSLGTELPKEMARVRDVLIPQYAQIGQMGGFAIALMRSELDRATKALAEGDVVTMMRTHSSIRKQSGAAIRASVLWPLDGGGVE